MACIDNRSKPQDSLYQASDINEFETLIADTDNVVLLDVRTQSEYDEGHLQNTLLIDINTDTFMVAARHYLPKEKTIAVYCRSGRRSAAAAEMLSADGYKAVNMEGGFIAWQKAGKPIEK